VLIRRPAGELLTRAVQVAVRQHVWTNRRRTSWVSLQGGIAHNASVGPSEDVRILLTSTLDRS
jgi:hypothetical protein